MKFSASDLTKGHRSTKYERNLEHRVEKNHILPRIEEQMIRSVGPRGDLLKISNPFLPRNFAFIGELTVQLAFLTTFHASDRFFHQIK